MDLLSFFRWCGLIICFLEGVDLLSWSPPHICVSPCARSLVVSPLEHKPKRNSPTHQRKRFPGPWVRTDSSPSHQGCTAEPAPVTTPPRSAQKEKKKNTPPLKKTSHHSTPPLPRPCRSPVPRHAPESLDRNPNPVRRPNAGSILSP